MRKPLYIKEAQKLSLYNNNIKIEKEDKKILINVEDVSSVFVEDPHVIITARLLSYLGENNVSLILCNEKFMPSVQSVPLYGHFNQVGILHIQQELSSELKNQLWQKIIKAKISNQKEVINLTTENEYVSNSLEAYSNNVGLNDFDNREGIAARVFFKEVYGDNFIRFGNNMISSALDYGYSILHSALTRLLVSYGFSTNYGIWHNSSRNPYNLASDLIEPFRPLVDYLLYFNLNKISFPLEKEMRIKMIKLLTYYVKMDKIYKVEYAMIKMIESLIYVYKTGDVNGLLLPEIVANKFYED